MKKKLLSLALSLTMCCCLTLSACAVGTGDAAAPDNTESTAEAFAGSGNDYEGTVDTFDSSENDSESTTGTSVSSEDAPVNSVEKFANSAGDSTVTDSKGNIFTLSEPILYTIPISELKGVWIRDEDEEVFEDPLKEYSLTTVFAIPCNTIITAPDDGWMNGYVWDEIEVKNNSI